MQIKDKLQIILITYNRAKFVRKTLEQFFTENSPVKECEFVIQDNNSDDNTQEVTEEFAKIYPNIKYTKNRYNLGLSGTIARAMEVADKDYVWIIGDDDVFDFSNWQEVENAIKNNEKMICVSRYSIPDDQKNNPACQIFQLTFITGGIYSTSLFNDTTIRNAFDNIYTLFPHIPPIIKLINDGGRIYTVTKPIADNGILLEEKDCTYTRGANKDDLYEKTRDMSWILGYANIISLLKDKKIKDDCMKIAIQYKDIYGSWDRFFGYMCELYSQKDKLSYFYEIYNALPDINKTILDWEIDKLNKQNL